MSPWFDRTFGTLRLHNFRILWSGSLLAFIAFFMSTVVQSVVAFDLTGNNSAVGFVTFAQGIAQLALGPFGGALADRVSKRLLIFTCQAIITAAFLGVAVLLASDAITVVLLALASFLIGSAFSFLGPARTAFTVELVGQERRGNAVALSQVALNGSRIIGPLAAGLFLWIDALGAAGAYFAMGALYVVAMVTTWVLPPGLPPSGGGSNVLSDIASGLVYVWRNPRIRSLVLSYVLVIMVGFPYVVVLPGLVETELDRSSGSITVLLFINAVGGLAASVAVASLADSSRAGAIQVLMAVVFGVALVLAGLVPSFALLGGAMLLVGFGSGGFQTLNGAIVSHVTDPAYFGRVISLTFLAFAAFGVIALPIGFVADALGERATLGIMGAGVLAIIGGFALFGGSLATPQPHLARQAGVAND